MVNFSVFKRTVLFKLHKYLDTCRHFEWTQTLLHPTDINRIHVNDTPLRIKSMFVLNLILYKTASIFKSIDTVDLPSGYGKNAILYDTEKIPAK